ncbi:MAG: hypothetical protein WDZ35_07855 [Crocinitomicaceae bacterium]
MKFLFLQILYLLPFGLIAQSDSIQITLEDLCPDLFTDTKVDSTYSNFYIAEEKDTIFFNNLKCVMLHQLTTPGTTIWVTKNGVANGIHEYTYKTSTGWTTISGVFKSGYFISGIETQYFPNGNKKCFGKYTENQRSGIWKWYTEDGKLEFKCEFIQGVCTELDE